MRHHVLAVCVLVLILGVPAWSAAQPWEPARGLSIDLSALPVEARDMLLDDPDGFGLLASFTTIPVTELEPLASGRDSYADYGQGYRKSENAGGSAYFAYGIGPTQGIPVGAYVFATCVAARDAIADGEVKVSMWGFEHAADNSDTVADHQYGAATTTGLAAMPGWTMQCTNPAMTVRTSADINNDGEENWTSYFVLVEVTKASPELRYGSGLVWWWRQISPAPATATFNDVPTGHWAFQHIEAVASSGITSGCSASAYCPDQPITRAQMAVFLAKALGLHWAD